MEELFFFEASTRDTTSPVRAQSVILVEIGRLVEFWSCVCLGTPAITRSLPTLYWLLTVLSFVQMSSAYLKNNLKRPFVINYECSLISGAAVHFRERQEIALFISVVELKNRETPERPSKIRIHHDSRMILTLRQERIARCAARISGLKTQDV